MVEDTCDYSKRKPRKMIQSELSLPSWQPFSYTSSPLNHTTPHDQEMDFCDFTCSVASLEESSVISSNSHAPTMFPDEFLDLENLGHETQVDLEGLETISGGEIDDICEWINRNDSERNSSSSLTIEGNEWSPCVSVESSQNSKECPLMDMSLLLPGEVEVDDQLNLIHLLRAYGEAMENGEKGLAEVIVKSINEKSNPMGNTMERVAYNIFRSREDEDEYIRHESSKNFLPAFKVLYQSLQNSRFAHVTATTAILESIPDDAVAVQIVDFAMGEGIQWSPLIEALSRSHKQLTLTSIKSEEGPNSCCWNFEDTKKLLLLHARQYGVNLHVEEKCIRDLSTEFMRLRKKGQGRDWLVFNCMVGLPHMAGRRTRRSVTGFLNIARELLMDREGIVTLGDGEPGESLNNCSSYSSYFDHLLRHYQALFESLERNIPGNLVAARMVMENLFLAPFICPETWLQDWNEMRNGYDVYARMHMKGVKHSQESLAAAQQMVNEGETSYMVKVEMLREHGMVLQWKETPLVRVSTWM